jgi:hypothetical protein
MFKLIRFVELIHNLCEYKVYHVKAIHLHLSFESLIGCTSIILINEQIN